MAFLSSGWILLLTLLKGDFVRKVIEVTLRKIDPKIFILLLPRYLPIISFILLAVGR